MRDPHVVSLTYAAMPTQTASFDGVPSLEGAIEGHRFSLEAGILRIEPNIHFQGIEQARADIDPLLAAWEIDIALRFGNPELTFRYETAEVIDRDPLPPGSPQTLQVQSLEQLTIIGNVTLRVLRTHYPEPPIFLRINPDVDTLWHRYQGYKSGCEPLPSMAYFCLTLLQAIAGNRQQASKTFKISINVLRKMGQLTSERGDVSTARKYPALISGSPLTGKETHWLEEAVKAIIRRVGELNSNKSLSIIELDDLPAL